MGRSECCDVVEYASTKSLVKLVDRKELLSGLIGIGIKADTSTDL